MLNSRWIRYFLKIALGVASNSKDRSTQVGCVIIGPDKEIRSTGYNGFPIGAPDDKEEWHQRPKKYLVVSHAEKNAVALAARVGIPLKGCIAFITLPPCSDCMTLLIQAGIVEIFALEAPEEWTSRDSWTESFHTAQEIALECKIPLNIIKRDFLVGASNV